MSEIKSCPFCGGEAKSYSTNRGFWGVDCESNECFTHTMVADYITEEEAIEAWNTRVDVPETNVGKTKAIDEFASALLKNAVVDKSVVRRVAEQMKERCE